MAFRIPTEQEISKAIDQLASLADNDRDKVSGHVFHAYEVALRWATEPNDWNIIDEAMSSAAFTREEADNPRRVAAVA